jgi:glucosamine 6-phosphate synthetase-like amidotransferase/phosphosugar isomerase protein
VFVSETDTEVVPHLCEYLWQKKGGNVSLLQLVGGAFDALRLSLL